MVLYGPVCSSMVPYGPMWSRVVLCGPVVWSRVAWLLSNKPCITSYDNVGPHLFPYNTYMCTFAQLTQILHKFCACSLLFCQAQPQSQLQLSMAEIALIHVFFYIHKNPSNKKVRMERKLLGTKTS